MIALWMIMVDGAVDHVVNALLIIVDNAFDGLLITVDVR